MAYFYDLHCHTTASSCSITSVKGIVAMAKKRGLDGVAITDHNKLYNGPTQIDGIDIIPGAEISVIGEDHILAYYIKEDVERGQSFQKTIEDIRNKDGYSVWAHPLRDVSDLNKEGEKCISLFDGLEAGNAMNTEKEQELISKKADSFSLSKFAGSDSHTMGQVGMGVIMVENKINRDNFLEEVRNGKIIIRDQIKNFRKRNIKWKRFLGFNKKLLNADKYKFIKYILTKVFLRSYLRINDVCLKRIKFNYKAE